MRKKLTRPIGVLTSAVLFVLLVLGFTSANATASDALTGSRPAAATPTCSGYGCDGKDPVQTNCAAGAYTAASTTKVYQAGTRFVPPTGIIVQLRYSPRCGTNWTRVLFTGWQANWVGVQVEATRVSPFSVQSYSYSGHTATVWGNQVYAPNGVCAYGWAEIDGWSYTFVGSTPQAC